MAAYTLVIGNRNYSSWSLRPWLALRRTGVAFEEVRIPLYAPGSRERVLEYSPSGKVPALRIVEDGAAPTVVWDSLAICETLAERHPQAGLWPEDSTERALARSISAEMHSGFEALRHELPMNCRAEGRRVGLSEAARADVARVLEIWEGATSKRRRAGSWLFGPFTIADAMYAPVALRFHSYGIPLPPSAAAYVATVLGDPDVAAWMAAGRRETEVIAAGEVGLAADSEA